MILFGFYLSVKFVLITRLENLVIINVKEL